MLHEVLGSAGAKRSLAERDVGAVYRLLVEAGVSQRAIAVATGQSQSEVCEILKGRSVLQVRGAGTDRGRAGRRSGMAGCGGL